MTDRYEAARKALADYDTIDGWNGTHAVMIANADALASALRALITRAPAGENLEAIAMEIVREKNIGWDWDFDIALKGILAGLQIRPTQEQMLRWLGIRYTESAENGYVYIPLQMIDREDTP